MYMDSNLRIEAVSSFLGQPIKMYDGNSCWGPSHRLSVEIFHLHNLTGRRPAYMELFIDEKCFFDPRYDFDFTNLSDTSMCWRGDEPYVRPRGWYRMALKVKGKYPDGDAWLGTNGWRSNSVPGEWPASYHGTTLKGAKGIINSHYIPGPRASYGRGIYSTPDLSIAEKNYAKSFTSQTTGKTYKVILQNRINPEKRKICSYPKFWLIPVDQWESAEKEKEIAESSIRPYGILIKEINAGD